MLVTSLPGKNGLTCTSFGVCGTWLQPRKALWEGDDGGIGLNAGEHIVLRVRLLHQMEALDFEGLHATQLACQAILEHALMELNDQLPHPVQGVQKARCIAHIKLHSLNIHLPRGTTQPRTQDTGLHQDKEDGMSACRNTFSSHSPP